LPNIVFAHHRRSLSRTLPISSSI